MTRWPSLNAKTMHAESGGCFPYGWGNAACASIPRRPACSPWKRQAWRAFRDGTRLPTFDDLGFTHYWSRSRTGKARLKRKTSNKRLRRALVEINSWLRQERNARQLPDLWQAVSRKMRGHFNDFGMTDNSPALYRFARAVQRLVLK